MSALSTPQVYTDLNSLQQIKSLGKTDKQAALESVAKQFESILVQMMMKSMREANAAFGEDDMTSSSEGKFYQDMFDNQLAMNLSQGRGFVIATAMMRQLQGRAGNTGAADAAPAAAGPAAFSLQNVARTLAAHVADTDGSTSAVPTRANERAAAAIQDA